MVNLSNEQLQHITNSVDIVDMIDQFVTLKKRGKNHFGFCPFHDERTPSFSVSQEKQLFKCFSCGRGGNVFSFFMEKDGLTFMQAVKKVVELANLPIEIESEPVEKTPKQLEKEQLIACHELAVEFYHHILLNTTEGEQALNYLMSRGLTLDTIRTFKIGVSVSQRDLLAKLLSSKDFSDDVIIKTGLVLQFDTGVVDRFTNRIMVPLRNDNGQCIAFSGRIYKELPIDPSSDYVEPKYLNSPETDLFHKSEFLFNLDLAKGPIRKQNAVVLSEGYMDVIAMYQAGVPNVVASMGTSLTSSQLSLLQRMAKQLVIAYDGDSAGVKATHRAIEIARTFQHFDISVVPMLNNMDPDEMIQQKGATYFINHLQHEQETVFNFYQRYYANDYALDTQKGQIDYIDALLNILLYEHSTTARALAIGQLSQRFHISETALQQQFDVLSKQKKRHITNEVTKPFHRDVYFDIPTTPQQLTKVEMAEKYLLKRILQDNDTLPLILSVDEQFAFYTQVYADVLANYQGHLYSGGSLTDFPSVLKVLEQQRLVTDLLLDVIDVPVSLKEIEQVIRTRNIAVKEETLEQLQKEINDAVKSGDKERVEELLLTYQMIHKEKR